MIIDCHGHYTTAQQYKVPCGHPHVSTKNVDEVLAKGFRRLMPARTQSFGALEPELKACGREFKSAGAGGH